MRSVEKYKPAIKDGRQFVVYLFADKKAIFNFNFLTKFHYF